jgi:hypothetical protein
MTKIPIFIITHDRYRVLNYSIDSYFKTITSPFEIVIFDQKSTFPPMIDYLRFLESGDITVAWNHRNGNMSEMVDDLRNVIQEWLKNHPSPYYVVTDSDVALDGCKGDILLYYAYLLEKFPDIECIGPMLRIDDIPDYYPLKKEAYERHYDLSWRRVPIAIPWEGINYHLLPSIIDTTFAMYRSSFPFKNYNIAFRSYAPYLAKHLDWYINPAEMTDDQLYYLEHARRDLANWGCRLFHEVAGKQ